MTGKRPGLFLTVVLAVAFGLVAANCKKSSSSNRGGPSISSITPGTGSTVGGETVSIVTARFSQDFLIDTPTSVTFGGAGSPSITGTGSGTLDVVTPAGNLGFVDVTVTALNGQTATKVAGFEYVAPTNCTVTQVSPGQGSEIGGRAVSIIGTTFEWLDPTLAVTFNGIPAIGVSGVDDTLITATTPACLGCGWVTVRVTSTNFDCSLPNAFQYQGVSTCQITQVTPGNGPLTGFTPVTLDGVGFTGATSVSFGGVPGTGLSVIDDLQLTVITPRDPLFNPLGNYDVTVVVTTPSSTCFLPAAYHYDAGVVACNIDNILPPNGSSVGGDAVLILGSGFKPAGIDPTVNFDGNPAVITFASNIQIDCTTPPGLAGPADVQIINSTGGTCMSPGGFTYDPANPQCNIAQITPNTGDAQGDEPVVITGSNFDATSNQVLFDGVLATITNQSAGQIDVLTPPGSAGQVDVEVFPQNGQACIGVGRFTYTGCSISNVIPSSGPLGGTNPVNITGSGFVDTVNVEVWFGSNQATVLNPPLPTPGSIVVQVPAGAALGPVNVTVINPIDGTQCTLVGGYTYAGCLVANLNPNNGPKMGGTTITITGSGLAAGNGALVRVEGNLATNVNISGAPGSITCDTPPSLTDGLADVEVINNDGTICSLPNGFSYDPAVGANCTITSINPTGGDIGGGTDVTITGSGFDPAGVGVLFGPNPGVLQSVFAGTIEVTSPPGAVLGPVSVHVVNANGGTCTSPVPFDYAPPAGCNLFCTPTGISPATFTVAAGGVATVTGDCDPPNLVGFCPLVEITCEVVQNTISSGTFSPSSGACDSLTLQVPPAPDGVPGGAVLLIFQPAGLCFVNITYN